jgi:hypothetical protein
MLHLCGIPVAPEAAQHLVATLIADGSPDAVAAAGTIAKGVDRELYAVALTPAERDAILSALEDPPDGLVELRGTLPGIGATGNDDATAEPSSRPHPSGEEAGAGRSCSC